MKRKELSIKYFSIIFLVLTLFLTVWSNVGCIYHQHTTNASYSLEKTTKEGNTSTENQTFITQDYSFDAVTNAGIVLDSVKTFILTPLIVHHFGTDESPSKTHSFSILLLNYFQNLFTSSILVNAP